MNGNLKVSNYSIVYDKLLNTSFINTININAVWYESILEYNVNIKTQDNTLKLYTSLYTIIYVLTFISGLFLLY